MGLVLFHKLDHFLEGWHLSIIDYKHLLSKGCLKPIINKHHPEDSGPVYETRAGRARAPPHFLECN